ncbi:MarR family transcriptional regulator [Actinomadura macrotermitis]|uniref:MarR family transcriptional regulator n=1 Tax=Actinomadura macrotermitis TaxID=2585200 RepID=A0A7K0C677_9ACTN|nr:MarR family transcriptional regulator [Actinomadura macrotermitis]MQY08935.1 hypothetical protein [Actinomadura macrotermitis]
MTPTLSPQVLGRAENAHRALLESLLAGSGLGYPQWVALKIAAGAGPADRGDLAARIAGALKTGAPAARAALDDLAAAGLLDDGGLTAAGRDLHDRLTAAVTEATARAYSAVTAADLATAGRVLDAVTARIDAELA